MDDEELVYIALLLALNKKKRRRRYWVHPLNTRSKTENCGELWRTVLHSAAHHLFREAQDGSRLPAQQKQSARAAANTTATGLQPNETMGLLDRVSTWLGGRPRVAAPVLVLGLDRAGKTSLLRALRPPDPNATATPAEVPNTATPQIEQFQSGGVAFSAWDVSGAARARALWERHYRRAQAVIFVVDAADHLRLVVAREELELVLAHPDMCARRIPLLVLGNKSDAAGALEPARLAAALGLARVVDRPWHVAATSARSGAGLADGIAWLARQLRELHTPARPVQN